ARSPRPWGALLPALACAVCPTCVATYAKLFSLAGVGLELSERQHALLLAVALAASIGASAFRAWRAKRAWPLAVALAGAALLLAGHQLGEAAWLEWAGVVTLLAGGLVEHVRLRRAERAAPRPAHA
ncbi:MAG TPA: MerC family mercury resistance protein, partial [Polyangiaceae bacterium]|nr:MerC family mercury resistance protein [Polyangiaceae bacterium]